MGQAERDRRRVERLEIERRHMEQKALEEAELLNPPDPAEALNHLEPDVVWGKKKKLAGLVPRNQECSTSARTFNGSPTLPSTARRQSVFSWNGLAENALICRDVDCSTGADKQET